MILFLNSQNNELIKVSMKQRYFFWFIINGSKTL